jgi:hypothetical protein
MQWLFIFFGKVSIQIFHTVFKLKVFYYYRVLIVLCYKMLNKIFSQYIFSKLSISLWLFILSVCRWYVIYIYLGVWVWVHTPWLCVVVRGQSWPSILVFPMGEACASFGYLSLWSTQAHWSTDFQGVSWFHPPSLCRTIRIKETHYYTQINMCPTNLTSGPVLAWQTTEPPL